MQTKKKLPKLKSATDKWANMTREERAVAVARDVISLVRSGMLTPQSGTYLHATVPMKTTDESDAQQALCNSMDCKVCAIGGAAVALVLGRNNVKIKQMGYMGIHSRMFGGSRFELVSILLEVFDNDTLECIESAFEGEWDRKYPEDDDRLVAIMRRVIKNKGSFSESDMFSTTDRKN